MKTVEIIKLEPGTKVYLVQGAKIKSYTILGANPKFENYFYFISTANVEDTFCIWVGEKSSSLNWFWETDYDKAKEEMWKQLQEHVKSVNDVYFNSEKRFNFDE